MRNNAGFSSIFLDEFVSKVTSKKIYKMLFIHEHSRQPSLPARYSKKGSLAASIWFLKANDAVSKRIVIARWPYLQKSLSSCDMISAMESTTTWTPKVLMLKNKNKNSKLLLEFEKIDIQLHIFLTFCCEDLTNYDLKKIIKKWLILKTFLKNK